MSDDRTALEQLAARLWDERHIVTYLLYKLTVYRLLLAADERRFAPEALREVDQAVQMLRDGELRRVDFVRDLAGLWQVYTDDVSLTALAATAPPPFDHTFGEHLAAFRELAAAIEAVSHENRTLARAELDHLTDSIEQITGIEPVLPSTDDAEGWLITTAGQLQSGVSRITCVRDLAVRAATLQDPGQKAAIATEIRAIADELVGIANTRHIGGPLFGGFPAGDAVPVTPRPPLVVSFDPPAGQADDEVRRRVSDTEHVRVNTTAAGWLGATGVDGEDLISFLRDLAADIAAGDQETISAKLAGLELPNVQKVDIAQGMIELQIQEIGYQATLQALAQTLPPSLVSFLR